MTTLIADPRVAAVPIIDQEEPLVDLRPHGIACSTDRPGCMVRSGVVDRLVDAQSLLPKGIRLLVVEGFRSREVQQRTFDGYAATVRATYPHLGEAESRRLTTRYVAPVEVAPHVAGAAVDVTLVDLRGTQLWLGSPVDATPEESDNACAFDALNINHLARTYRTILSDVLTSAGLVNYPTEWWHWSFGDRYWAHLTKSNHARYGPLSGGGA